MKAIDQLVEEHGTILLCLGHLPMAAEVLTPEEDDRLMEEFRKYEAAQAGETIDAWSNEQVARMAALL